MNEVLHKHSVIRPHNSPTSWEQLFAVVQRDELRQAGFRLPARYAIAQWPQGAGSWVCTEDGPPYVQEERA